MAAIMRLVRVEETEGNESVVLFTLRLCNGENRFTKEMIKELMEGLTMVEERLQLKHSSVKAALIITGVGKYFSLGLDLASFANQHDFETSYNVLIARILTFPLITVAAINGHAIAGGMVLAMACDYQVMNGERGYLAMNEINLPSSIPSGMLQLIKEKIGNSSLASSVFLRGEKYTAKEFRNAGGTIHEIVEADENKLEDLALKTEEMARRMASEKAHIIAKVPFLGVIKTTLYKGVLNELNTPESFDHFLYTRRILSKL